MNSDRTFLVTRGEMGSIKTFPESEIAAKYDLTTSKPSAKRSCIYYRGGTILIIEELLFFNSEKKIGLCNLYLGEYSTQDMVGFINQQMDKAMQNMKKHAKYPLISAFLVALFIVMSFSVQVQSFSIPFVILWAPTVLYSLHKTFDGEATFFESVSTYASFWRQAQRMFSQESYITGWYHMQPTQNEDPFTVPTSKFIAQFVHDGDSSTGEMLREVLQSDQWGQEALHVIMMLKHEFLGEDNESVIVEVIENYAAIVRAGMQRESEKPLCVDDNDPLFSIPLALSHTADIAGEAKLRTAFMSHVRQSDEEAMM